MENKLLINTRIVIVSDEMKGDVTRRAERGEALSRTDLMILTEKLNYTTKSIYIRII